ncbi:hypothetical protein QYE76_054461, partial [Lolium multiflorum]
YEEDTSIARGGEKKLDVKMDVELDMELDMKISHGCAREEREACARGEDKVQAGPTPGQTGRHSGAPGQTGRHSAPGPWPGPTGRHARSGTAPTGRSPMPTGRVIARQFTRPSTRSRPGLNRQPGPSSIGPRPAVSGVCLDRSILGPQFRPEVIPDAYISAQDAPKVATYRFMLSGYVRKCVELRISCKENKDAADLMTWREYEALRNKMRREFHAQDDELKGTVQGISQKLNATSATVTTMRDQMTDIQRSLQGLQLAVDNLTNLQQQEDEDEDEAADEAPNANRGAARGNRGRGFAELRRPGRGFEEEDGSGKPKFSIPKFEGGADVEKYLTWELKIEKLWRLHNYTEDRKIKLASSKFDGYALRWWYRYVSAREEDGEPPIITWRAMKAAMTERFVPTNYLRNIFDKLTLLRQGVKTIDEYYMEMEMLMQRGRVKESLEMTMTRFLNGLKYDIKGIVRHCSYTIMNELLHHATEAESQLADEAKVKGRTTEAGHFTPRAPPSTAPAPSMRSAHYSTPPSKPVSNVQNTKKSESAASTSGSSMSTTRNRDMNCHTCGGKGHFRRDCLNRKVMIVNEDNEYETGDDVDPNAPEDEDYGTDGVDAYPSKACTIVVSQRALNVLPSASTQRCNLFQTKALVGPDKACKVIIDGGSCRNLASKELCTKLKLKYLPHPHP